MPLFTRRRLQNMLTEIAPNLGPDKAKDLLSRLDNKRVDQALPAEIELAFIWALLRCGDGEIEPVWWAGKRRPDIYTEALIPGQPSIIEIAAPNDNSISGESNMDGVAQRIIDWANRARPGIGSYLYFRFREEHGYQNGNYFRRRLAPDGYQISTKTKLSLKSWIESGDIERSKLRVLDVGLDVGLDVEIEKTAHKKRRYHNVWSSMPPEAYSIDDNPLYQLLTRKSDQLGDARKGTHRFIFLGDAGSTLINQIGSFGEFDATRRRVSGKDIINHFVQANYDKIEAIIVIAPSRSTLNWTEIGWRTSIFSRPGFSLEANTLDRFVTQLPKPRFEGYQTRSLFRQGAFKPTATGWYLATHFEWNRGDGMKAKISTRNLMDFLAGRKSEAQFRSALGERSGEIPFFKRYLDRGQTIQSVKFESGGIDNDDDFIVFTFCDDPAAQSLRLPDDTEK